MRSDHVTDGFSLSVSLFPFPESFQGWKQHTTLLCYQIHCSIVLIVDMWSEHVLMFVIIASLWAAWLHLPNNLLMETIRLLLGSPKSLSSPG